MKGKLTNIYNEISDSEKLLCKYPTPEYIAYEYMKWIEEHTGKKISYFRNSKRNGSRSWKKFTELAEYIEKNFEDGMKIPMSHYFDKLSEFYWNGSKLYVNQLLTKDSYNILYGDYYDKPVNPNDGTMHYDELEKWLYIYQKDTKLSLNYLLEEFFPSDFADEFRRRNYMERKRCKLIIR